MARMSHYLERAGRDAPSETENVHQLRVFSRRAAAAIEIFADWLPKKRGRWLQRQVKRVRKAAGAARDCDVLSKRWLENMQHAPSSHAALLLEHVKQRRGAAQAPIEAIDKKLAGKHFDRRVRKILKCLRYCGDGEPAACGQQFACLARGALRRLVVPYLAAARAELGDGAAMHAFRLLGKQVRYAMEIFAGAFDEEFRTELYPLVALLQERLGAINDHVTAQTCFAAWHTQAESCAVRAALETGIDCEQRGFEAARREFLDWWTAGRLEDLTRRFARYVDLGAPDPAAEERPEGCCE